MPGNSCRWSIFLFRLAYLPNQVVSLAGPDVLIREPVGPEVITWGVADKQPVGNAWVDAARDRDVAVGQSVRLVMPPGETPSTHQARYWEEKLWRDSHAYWR